jgi:hypothetical protein
MVKQKEKAFDVEKKPWIPRIFLLVMCIGSSLVYLISILGKDDRLILGELFIASLWISFFISFLFKKYIALSNLVFNVVSLAAYFYCLDNFTYYCHFAFLGSLLLIVFIFLPILVTTTVMFFDYSRQLKKDN